MDILFLLIPLSMVFVALVGVVLYWAIQSGQFDELEQHGSAILDDKDQSADANHSGT